MYFLTCCYTQLGLIHKGVSYAHDDVKSSSSAMYMFFLLDLPARTYHQSEFFSTEQHGAN